MAIASSKLKTPQSKLSSLNKLFPYHHYPKDMNPVKEFDPEGKLVDNETYLGIEVELEQVPAHIGPLLSQFWNVKPDGSLRNNGLEFVSYPLRGSNLVFALESIYRFFNEVKAVASPRTSVHVHMNVQNMTIEEIRNFLSLYIIFERVLYDFIGFEREKNNFCIPWYSYPHTFYIWKYFENADIGQLLKGWLKYTGLNLRPMTNPDQGTIEFRHFSGSTDVQRVLTWINILLSMRQTAVAIKPAELDTLVLKTSASYLTTTIFKDLAPLFKDKPLQLMIDEGRNDFILMKQMAAQTLYKVREEGKFFRVMGA